MYQEPGLVAVSPVQMRREAATEDSVGRRCACSSQVVCSAEGKPLFPIATCLDHAPWTPAWSSEYFCYLGLYLYPTPFLINTLLKLLKLPVFVPFSLHRTSVEHSLYWPSTGIPVSVEFCMSSSPAPSCCSIHPSHWVLLPCCYPQLINRHGWGCMNYPVAHSKWEQAGNRSHPHPEPQTPLGTLKPQYLQYGRQGSTFPCSTEGAWGKGILLLSHGVIRGQRPHSCKLQPFRKCLMQALWQPLLLQCFHFEKENRSNIYNSLNE